MQAHVQDGRLGQNLYCPADSALNYSIIFIQYFNSAINPVQTAWIWFIFKSVDTYVVCQLVFLTYIGSNRCKVRHISCILNMNSLWHFIRSPRSLNDVLSSLPHFFVRVREFRQRLICNQTLYRVVVLYIDSFLFQIVSYWNLLAVLKQFLFVVIQYTKYYHICKIVSYLKHQFILLKLQDLSNYT